MLRRGQPSNAAQRGTPRPKRVSNTVTTLKRTLQRCSDHTTRTLEAASNIRDLRGICACNGSRLNAQVRCAHVSSSHCFTPPLALHTQQFHTQAAAASLHSTAASSSAPICGRSATAGCNTGHHCSRAAPAVCKAARRGYALSTVMRNRSLLSDHSRMAA